MKKIYLVIIFLLIFIINTIFVVNNSYLAIDSKIYQIVYSIHSDTITTIMKIITFFGSTLFMVVLSSSIFFYFSFRNKNKIACSSALLILTSTLLNNIIKPIIKRVRPEYIMVAETTFSYPSGHMMASTTMYGFIIYLIFKSNCNKKKFYISLLLILIVLIGISRIYLGAHYFSDIMGASILSLTLLLLYSIFDDKYKIQGGSHGKRTRNF